MAKERKGKHDLDSILSEINSSIKKETNQPKVDHIEVETDATPLQKQDQAAKFASQQKKQYNKADFSNTQKKTSQPDENSHPVRFVGVTSNELIEEENTAEPIEAHKENKNMNSPNKARDLDVDKSISRKRPKPKMTKRHKRTAVLGFLMTIFVIIGVVASIWAVSSFTGKVINNSTQKEALAKEIFPFVIIDIPEFDQPSKLDNSAIVSSAIWEFIIDEKDKSKYPKDDLGSIYVPAIDIEYYIRRLFGNDVKIIHQTVDDTSVQMTYDETAKTYTIESTPKFLPYKPRVDKISKSGDIYTLKVSYILPDAMWNFDTKHKVEEVDKTMEYVLKKNKDSYQVLSVKLLSVEGAISSTIQSPSMNDENSSNLQESSEDSTSNTESEKNKESESSDTSSAAN